MDYQFENLGFERFQEVCQSLLVREFPSVQCFPVGQPDGGRDAIRFLRGVSADDFIVYQVKFARRPQAIEAPHKWLVDTIEEELPKIRKLIPKGASAYYLLTNVSGTAHPDAGSIDILNGMLTTSIDIPSHCWWRDDLNRRLDNAWDVKWSYPELLSGPDMLRMIVESGLSEDRERRTAAIKSFVRDQFDRDQEVRFKQVDLQSNLLDLFIDVPIHSGDQAAPRRRHAFHLGLRYLRQFQGMPEEIFETREEAAVGAATLLLSTEAQEHMPHIVLEGAPGQGKSTIVQYIAQIHRRRILGESVDFPSIPPTHRICPVRLPFKIDLRDLATWLTKKDPFSAADEQDAPVDWEKSLEAFMAAQVRHHSGGMAFSTTDLIAVARFSSLLVVFDGLDEVASVSRRQEVVEVIQRGLHRLKDHSVSLQAIVTSRPAAFANSPGLSEQEFTYLELGAITRPLINEYANRWIAAKHLDSRESREVRSILKDKLDQPHLRELARNPMQLTILLNLIHTRGASLPDKRTALYDSYMETFFNREAEKSAIVREHRDLLIDIHRYLAWILHSEAETTDNRGSIPTDRLKALISQYLAEEEHDFSLSERLFTGMVERVVALVSRVEGMFEFEVQPLREYFAARYLYDTAPYSPPGAERRGTRPERFAAIAKNPYWFNVARFYAGCYSKGELASLVDGLDDLATSDGYKFTNHPHTLAATLLADWVFA